MPIFIVSFKGLVIGLLVIGGLFGAPKITLTVLFLALVWKVARFIMRMVERSDNRRFRRDVY